MYVSDSKTHQKNKNVSFLTPTHDGISAKGEQNQRAGQTLERQRSTGNRNDFRNRKPENRKTKWKKMKWEKRKPENRENEKRKSEIKTKKRKSEIRKYITNSKNEFGKPENTKDEKQIYQKSENRKQNRNDFWSTKIGNDSRSTKIGNDFRSTKN